MFTQLFVGGSVGYFFPTDKKCRIRVVLKNTTGCYSLFFHMADDIDRAGNPPYKKMSSINQELSFDIIFDENRYKK